MSEAVTNAAEQSRAAQRGAGTKRLISRAALLGACIYALLSLGLAIAHRSNDPVFLGRYSLTYLVFIIYILAVTLAWAALTYLVLRGGSGVKSVLRWLFDRWPGLAGLGVAALYLAGLYLGQKAPSEVAPAARFMPVALLSLGLLAVMIEAVRYALAQPAPSPAPQPAARSLPLLDRLRSAAEWAASGRRAAMFTIGSISVVALLLFLPVLLDPGTIASGGDALRQNYVYEDYNIEALRAGQIPFWNPYQFMGTPHLANTQTLVFYPLQLIFRFLPANLSFTWAALLHVWLAGLGMAALCRRLKLNFWVTLACALVYMLDGSLILRIEEGHPWAVYAIALLPWAWLLTAEALERPSPLATAGAGLAVGLIILTGHPAWAFYGVLFVGLVGLFTVLMRQLEDRDWPHTLVALARLAFIMLLGLGLSAPATLPVVTYSQQTSLSGGYGLKGINLAALTLPRLLAFLVPAGFELLPWEWIIYIGILPTLAVPFALSRRKSRPLAWFLAFVVLLSLVLAFGHSGLLYTWLYKLIPPFRLVRIPPRALIMMLPAAVVLSGMGLQALLDRDAGPCALRLGRWYAAALALLLAGSLAALIAFHFTGVSAIALPVPQSLAGAALSALLLGAASYLILSALLHRPGWLDAVLLFAVGGGLGAALLLGGHISLAPAVWAGYAKALVLLGVGLLLLSLIQRNVPPQALLPLIVVIIAVDLFSFARPHVFPHDPPRNVLQDHPEHLALMPHGTEGRLLPLEGGSRSDSYQMAAFMLSRISIIGGYGALEPGPQASFNGYVYEEAIKDCDLRPISFLNVTYVLAPEDPACPGLELIARTPDYILFRNPAALPRVYWVNEVRIAQGWEETYPIVADPDFSFATTVVLEEPVPLDDATPAAEPTVDIVNYIPYRGEMVVQTTTSQAGVLVFGEPWYSERRIWLDDEEVPALRANHAFIAAALPPGSHTVRLTYVPTSFRLGLGFAGASLIVVLVLVAVHFRPGRRGQAPARAPRS